MIKRILIDVSNVYENDNKTGIPRVVKGVLSGLRETVDKKIEIIPVCLDKHNGIFAVKDFPYSKKKSELYIETNNTIFLGLDYNLGLPLFKQILAGSGLNTYFILHDMIPNTHPEYDWPTHSFLHWVWFKSIVSLGKIITVSKYVAQEAYALNKKFKLNESLQIGWFRNAADIANTTPTMGLTEKEKQMLKAIDKKTNFLMVGTIEPKRGYNQVLSAFENLWKKKYDINLIIVGKKGWSGKDFDIEKFTNKLETHPLKNKNLFWFEGPSDEVLDILYSKSTCLIQASFIEGFGLPIIEAAKKGTPLIVRDIPIFREVTENHALFFKNSKDPAVIVEVIEKWFDLYKKKSLPNARNIHIPSWKEASEKILEIIFEEKWDVNLSEPNNWVETEKKLETFDFLVEKLKKKNNIVIFGAGGAGNKTLGVLESLGLKINLFLDNNEKKNNTIFEGIPVVHPSNFDFSKKDYFILIASMWRNEIANQLKSYGLKELIDFL